MFQNNMKIALRVFNRQKLFTVINTFSLCVGLACVSLIYLFIQDELAFDKFHERRGQIHRVVIDYLTPEGDIDRSMAYRPLPLGPALERDFPEIEAFTRVSRQTLFVRGNGQVLEEPVLFADAALFDIFTFPMKYGNQETALSQLGNVVISERLALKYFNRVDVVGESFSLMFQDKLEEFQISGVLENVPYHSSVHFDILARYDELPYFSYYKNSWSLSTDETFVLLGNSVSLTDFNAKIARQWEVYTPDEVEEIQNGDEPDQQYRLQPLREVHLDTSMASASAASDPVYSYILGGIALVILLIACANFTILSIARSAKRGKEIGVRKVIGASRKQLIGQFWCEALLLGAVSMFMALALVWLLLPTFNQLTDKHLEIQALFSLDNSFSLVLITLAAAAVAGFYPAIVMSGLKVLDIFRKKIQLGGTNLFTKVLVTSQFSLSILLVIGTMVMLDQLDYLKNRDLGFNDENVIVVTNQLRRRNADKLDLIKSAFSTNPGVRQIGMTSASFTKGGFNSSFEHKGTEVPYSLFRIDVNYLETLGIEVVDGRNFQADIPTDSAAVVVNQAFMEAMGPDFTVGDRLKDFENAGLNEPVVIGVVKDYYFESLANELKPTLLAIRSFSGFQHMLVKVESGQTRQILTELERQWYDVVPDIPFQSSLLNEDMDQQYASEDKWAKIIQWSAYIAISIALLGLLGLVGLSFAGRVKEIGIRMVLGAEVTHIFHIVFRQFHLLMAAAFVLAIPLSIYLLEQWLSGFAHHVSIRPWIYIITAGVFVLLTVLVISLNTFKVARTNPVDALRIE